MNTKVALVTGANRGIGFEVCRQLGKKGLTVILSSRNPDLGARAAQQLEKEGIRVNYHQLDVTDPKSIDTLFAWVRKEFRRLDVLVNNAGIFRDEPRDESSILTTEIQPVRDSLETNTFAPLRMIQKAVPLMKEHAYGRIVNLSSGMGQLTEMNGGYPGYRLSKVALNAVTRIAADELKETGILVNSICPGWVKTDMGGPGAELSVEQGADSIVWAATLPDGGPSGGFFRERKKIEW